MESSADLRHTKQVQGLVCILVLLHHLSDHVEGLWFFKYVGYLPVSVFLFYSGYGLYQSFTRKPRYLKKLAFLRIPQIVIAYIAANLAYLFVRFLTGTLSITSIRGFLFGGNALVTYSWYIICLLYLYVAFLLSFLLYKRGRALAFFCLTSFVAVWIIVMMRTSGGIHRYNAILAFLMGGIVGHYDSGGKVRTGHRWMICALCVFLPAFAGATWLSIHDETTYVRLLCMVGASLSFASLMYLLARSGRVRGKLFALLGRISLEFYLYQGLMMLLLRNKYFYISNDLLFCVLTLGGVFGVALVMNKVDQRLSIIWEKLVNSLGWYKVERVKKS